VESKVVGVYKEVNNTLSTVILTSPEDSPGIYHHPRGLVCTAAKLSNENVVPAAFTTK